MILGRQASTMNLKQCLISNFGFCFCSVAKSCPTLQPHGLRHARLPWPSLSPGVCSNSCPLSQWCHLILCPSLLLLPSISPSIRVFSNELSLCIRWPKDWSFSFSISPFKEYLWLISFRIDWFHLLAVQGLSRVFSSTIAWQHQFLVLSLLYDPTLTSAYMTTGKTIA